MQKARHCWRAWGGSMAARMKVNPCVQQEVQEKAGGRAHSASGMPWAPPQSRCEEKHWGQPS